MSAKVRLYITITPSFSISPQKKFRFGLSFLCRNGAFDDTPANNLPDKLKWHDVCQSHSPDPLHFEIAKLFRMRIFLEKTISYFHDDRLHPIRTDAGSHGRFRLSAWQTVQEEDSGKLIDCRRRNGYRSDDRRFRQTNGPAKRHVGLRD